MSSNDGGSCFMGLGTHSFNELCLANHIKKYVNMVSLSKALENIKTVFNLFFIKEGVL
jgi:hypothetical protein